MADDETLTNLRLVGSWSLDSLEVSGAAGVMRTEFPGVLGLLTYTDSGHMSALVQAPESLFGWSFVAYGGRFTVKGREIIHHVMVGMEPTVPGVSVIREASLIRSAAAELLKISGRIGQTDTTLVWRKNPPA
ncbi:hypothetical protein ACWCOZ_33675 [Streptomyces sp. NPDC001840]